MRVVLTPADRSRLVTWCILLQDVFLRTFVEKDDSWCNQKIKRFPYSCSFLGHSVKFIGRISSTWNEVTNVRGLICAQTRLTRWGIDPERSYSGPKICELNSRFLRDSTPWRHLFLPCHVLPAFGQRSKENERTPCSSLRWNRAQVKIHSPWLRQKIIPRFLRIAFTNVYKVVSLSRDASFPGLYLPSSGQIEVASNNRKTIGVKASPIITRLCDLISRLPAIT